MVTELMMQVRIQTEMVCLMQLIVKVQQAQQEQLVQQALQVQQALLALQAHKDQPVQRVLPERQV